MNTKMQIALMLAENINSFIKFVHNGYDNKRSLFENKDKFYQIKLLIEEFRFQIVADELHRINQFDWDEKYTNYLADEFLKGMTIIDEYVKNNYDDLFILTGRLHTLKSISASLKE